MYHTHSWDALVFTVQHILNATCQIVITIVTASLKTQCQRNISRHFHVYVLLMFATGADTFEYGN